MPTLDKRFQDGRRDGYIAFACILGIFCGFAVTRPTMNLERGLLVWSAFCICCGLVLRYPSSGHIRDAFVDACLPVATLIVTIVLKLGVVFLLSGASGKSLTLERSPFISGSPILLALIPLAFVAALLALIYGASTVTIAIASISSDVIARVGQRAMALKPSQVTKVEKLIKAFTAAVAAFFILWATIAK